MKKQPTTLSDKLNKLFAPEEQHSEESGDETAPKFSEFDETPDDVGKDAALSEFRKRNIRFLEEFDRKYKGTVSSRSETFDDDEDDGGSDEDDDDDDDDELEDVGHDEDTDQEKDTKRIRKSKPKSLVLLKPPQSDDDQDDEDDSGEEDDEGSSDDDQEESLADYTDKRKQQHSTQSMTLIKEENRQETINKGLAVQNQLKIWERLLEMRIKVQPCLIASNSLPPPSSVYQNVASQNEEFRQKTEQTAKTVSETMDQLLELQEVLLGRFSETKTLLKSGSKRKAQSSSKAGSKPKQSSLHDYEQILASRCKDMEAYRNSVLVKWHDRTNIASKMRNNAKQSQSVLKKIEESLINRADLVRKTQLYRGGYTLLGRQSSADTAAAANEQREEVRNDETQEQTPTAVYDGEIFDDSDFYHQMLRELIEYKTSTTDSPQEIANKLAELQKLRNKMKKTVDTKASKGRKIRYVVHKKLVNFMAPVPDYGWTDEAKDELFGSLFGQTPATEER